MIPERNAPLARHALTAIVALWIAGGALAHAQTGSITGTVTRDTGGAAVPGIFVQIQTPQGAFQGQTTTNASGVYTVGGLTPGTYVLRTFNGPIAGLVDEYHANVFCPGPACVAANATSIAVVANQATTVNVGLATGGSITGTIRNAQSNAVLQGVQVTVYRNVSGSLYFTTSTATNASGVYTLQGLPTGNYQLITDNQLGFVDEVYDVSGTRTCPGAGCVLTQGSQVAVTQGAVTPSIDFSFDPGGSISGFVSADQSGTPPLEFVSVVAYLRLPGGALSFGGESTTDINGAYAITGLPTGQYVLDTNNSLLGPGYVDELYDDISCPADACDFSTGTPVGVTAPSPTANINFLLAQGVNISGVVQEDCGELPCSPLASASVELFTAAGSFIASVLADSGDNGFYQLPAVPAGSYRLRVFTFAGNYVDQVWAQPSNEDCVGALCDMSVAGDLLVVDPFQTPPNTDFFLRNGGTIAGTVTSAVGGVGPVAGVTVEIWKLVSGTARFVRSAVTDASGAYSVIGLGAGSGTAGYRARANGSPAGHASEVHAGLDCLGNACDVNLGATIDVTNTFPPSPPPSPATIDFTIDRLGIVAGTITSSTSAQPIQGATLTLFNAGGSQISQVPSDPAGGYQFGSLTPGSYRVRATAPNFRGEVFADVKCTGSPTFSTCSVLDGGLIAAALNTVTSASLTLDPLATLTVQLAGTGTGRAAALGAFIDCRNDGGGPSTCSEVFVAGSPITLVAVPASGSAFTGWSGGGCTGTGFCQATLAATATVTATFVATGGPPALSGVLPASGPVAGGTEIAIAGTNLAVSPAVTIGGAAATVVSASPTLITALTPPGVAGPRDIVVTTPGGQATLPGGFTYVAASKVSDEAAGANDETLQPSLSYDGRYLAFLSLATNVVSGDTNGVGDIFVRDRVTGVVVRVSVASDGRQADGASERPRISDDGRFVAFVSSATNLVAGDTNDASDVFVHDRDFDGNGVFDEASGRRTIRVSVASDGQQALGASGQPDLSADGRWVAFVSSAANLVGGDTNDVDDVFLHHWPSGQTTRVSVATGGGQANGPSRAPSVSDAGRRVVFASDATNLVAGDGNGLRDVFLHEREDGSTVRVSTAAGTINDANGASDNPSIDNAGVTVAFQTTASNISGGPAGPPGVSQVVVMVLDVPAGTLSAASGVAAGAMRVGLPVVNIADAIRNLVSQNGQGQAGNGASTNPQISGDGNAVGFESEGDNLTLGDSNGTDDVFVAGITDGGAPTTPVRVSVDTQGNEANGASQSPAMSGDGRLTSFESVAPLTPESTGASTSVFVRGERLLVSRFSAESTVVNTATTITIEGAGFQAGIRVRFGTLESPQVQRDGTTRLTAAVPLISVPTVVDVTVFNPDGESVTLRRSFTYTAAPLSGPDTDGDGLPSAWESQFGLDPASAAGPNGADGDPDGDGATNAEELARGTHPRGIFVRYLAEGAATDFFTTRVALANPSATESAIVLLRFQRSVGSEITLPLVVPPRESRRVVANDVPGLLPAEFATVVESDVEVTVDRQMTWDRAAAYGSHAEGALRAPRTVWYLAEGATHSGFDLFYLLQNPSPTATAQVKVRYLLPSGAPLEKTYTVGPRSRANIWVDNEEFPAAGSGNFALGSTDVSAVVEATNGVPIIVERAMYLTRGGQLFAAGHESAGVAAPSLSWFLAEGATGAFFDEFILLANPDAQPATARITYLLEGGATYTRTIDVPANSRRTIWVDLEQPDGTTGQPLASVALSARVDVTNGVPIIVERSMWWAGEAAAWYEAHNSPGSTVTGTAWIVAEGEVQGNISTYLLVANTSGEAAEVAVTLLFDGLAPLTRTFQVPATSRTTIDVGAAFPEALGRQFGALVESQGPQPAQIVVERAMYLTGQGLPFSAGSNQLASRLR